MPSQNTENTFHDRKPAAGLKLSIFTRLVTGYVIIFMLIVCVGIYINMQFSELKNVIGSLITVNNRISSYNKSLYHKKHHQTAGRYESSGWLDIVGFIDIQPAFYWSSTSNFTHNNLPFIYDLRNREKAHKSQNSKLYFLPVRSLQ